MKWSNRIFFLIATAVLVALAAVISRHRLLTPDQILREARLELESGSYDPQGLLRRLSSGLRRAESGDPLEPAELDVIADLRLVRGRLLLEIGATDQARLDFNTVLEKYRPGDRESRGLLIEAEVAEGDLEGALDHIGDLLADEPGFGPAWAQSGALHQRLAEDLLLRVDEIVHTALVEEDAALARRAVRELAARDAADPARAHALLELRTLFDGSDDEGLATALSLCDEATIHLTACRRALLKGLSIELDGDSLQRYLNLLGDARRELDAVALGTLVASADPETSDPRAAEFTIRLLLERGDGDRAARLAARWVTREEPLSPEFLRLACEALYRGREFRLLPRTAQRLRNIGKPEDARLASLYSGLIQAGAREPRTEMALRNLSAFARSRGTEPFAGALRLAWTKAAEMHRLDGDLPAEREAVQSAITSPGPSDGRLWLRRSELLRALPHGGYNLPLTSWATGMNLLPGRTEELLPTFIELGEARLEAEERDLEVLLADLELQNRPFPERDLGPYVLWRLAVIHGAQDRPDDQESAARRLLEDYPDFVPAMDQVIAARRALRDERGANQMALRRVELEGRSTRAEALLADLATRDLDPEQRVRLMRAAPRASGRLQVARWQSEQGDLEGALRTLNASAITARTDEESLLGARLLLEQGNHRLAERWLEGVEDASRLVGERDQLRVEVALGSSNAELLGASLPRLLKARTTSPQDVLALADRMMRENRVGLAIQTLETLSADELGDPGPLLWRRFQAALLIGNEAEASDALERAAAFVSARDDHVGRLLIGAVLGGEIDVAAEVRALRALDAASDPSPLEVTLLDLLEGRSQEALEASTFALSLTPGRPTWALAAELARDALGLPGELPAELGESLAQELPFLLRATGGADGMAAWLLAAGRPSLRPLVDAKLSDLGRAGKARSWAQLLEGGLRLERGDLPGAEASFRTLLRRRPECLPAWDALETTLAWRVGSPLDPRVEKVRRERLVNEASLEPEGAAALLLSSLQQLERGLGDEALATARQAGEAAPGWFEAELLTVGLESLPSPDAEDLARWHELIESTGALDAARAKAGLVAALERAVLDPDTPLHLGILKRELDALDDASPMDPDVLLALSRLDLRIERDNPAFGLNRALSRLRQLRAELDGQPVESLRQGATARWALFHVETAPDSAEDFLIDELALQPGNLDLWLLLGRVQRELGRPQDSYATLARVALMAPSPEVQLELARTLVDQGSRPQNVLRAVREAGRLARAPLPIADRLLTARSLVDAFTPEDLEAGLAELEGLWAESDQADSETLVSLARLYGRALLLRGEASDIELAMEVLATALPAASGPYEQELMEGLLGVARARAVVTG